MLNYIRTKKWSSLSDKNLTVYVPVLDAFKKELHRLYLTNPSKIASSLGAFIKLISNFNEGSILELAL
jgi:hypothetical protein